MPVYLYSVPAFTGLPWPPELTPLLAAHPRIRGIKESSGDINLFSRIAASVPSGFETACGNATVFYPALCLGAAGGVLGVSNCAPRATLALYKAFCAGDHEKARRIQRALLPLASAMVGARGGGAQARDEPRGDARRRGARAAAAGAAPSLLEEIRPLLAARRRGALGAGRREERTARAGPPPSAPEASDGERARPERRPRRVSASGSGSPSRCAAIGRSPVITSRVAREPAVAAHPLDAAQEEARRGRQQGEQRAASSITTSSSRPSSSLPPGLITAPEPYCGPFASTSTNGRALEPLARPSRSRHAAPGRRPSRAGSGARS